MGACAAACAPFTVVSAAAAPNRPAIFLSIVSSSGIFITSAIVGVAIIRTGALGSYIRRAPSDARRPQNKSGSPILQPW